MGLILFLLAALSLDVSLVGAIGAEANKDASEKNKGKSAQVRKVDVDEFEKLWQQRTNVVLDVRSKKEFDGGHVPGAVNINVNAPDFEQNVSALEKQKTYLVHCGAGVRSARACEQMSKLGFTNLVDLTSGFTGWKKAGKKVEQ